jgi:hypothetical protein
MGSGCKVAEHGRRAKEAWAAVMCGRRRAEASGGHPSQRSRWSEGHEQAGSGEQAIGGGQRPMSSRRARLNRPWAATGGTAA